MKIVIDIPEEWFCRLQNEWGWALAENVREAIKKGKPLPKGHGRLIDADAYKEQNNDILDCEIDHPKYQDTLRELIDHAPTIIEADKETKHADK